MTGNVKQRLRITFAKGPQLKFISHLDLVLAWERALRRAGVALAYSQGFNPQAKIQVAAALPVGSTGTAEVLDVVLQESLSPSEFLTRLNPILPQGLSASAVEEVEMKAPSLQSTLRQAEYRVTVKTGLAPGELAQRIADLLAADRLEQQRRRRRRVETFDLRPLVNDIRLESVEGERACLWMRLSAGQQGNVRPDAVLTALGMTDAQAQVERTKLLFEFDRQ